MARLGDYCLSFGNSFSMSYKRTTELPVTEVRKRVYFAARDGMAITIYAMLCNRDKKCIQQILSSATEDQGQNATPFIIAARNGHEKVCRMLLTQFLVDIEQCGTVRFDGFTIEGATALWCAAAAGHYEVAKTLVQFGADVNHATFSNSTPLRAACFDGRLDIVKFLVHHGADLTISNKYSNTCLMIACYRGHRSVVSFLLENGANPDMKAHCGATALHFAAECGQHEIVKELLSYGASMLINDHGMSPLHIAAESAQAEVVEYFIDHPKCSRIDRVEALELLGASFANDKDHYNIEKAFNYMWLAMHERYMDPGNILLKKVHPSVKAYGNRVECQSVSELEQIKEDHETLHMEALIARERILGEHNPEIPQPIIFRGAVYADTLEFNKCIDLWMRALNLRIKCERTITKDLLRFAQVFSQMIHIGIEVKFDVLAKIVEHLISEIKFNKQKIEECTGDEKTAYTDILDSNLHTMLYLLVIGTKLKLTSIQEIEFYKLVYRIVRMNMTFKRLGHTLLHAAIDDNTAVDDFHIVDVVSFPNMEVVKLLVKCGANVNACDNHGDTPLHVIMKYNKPISDFLSLHSIIIVLLENNAHADVTNNAGNTPVEVATTGVAEIILRTKNKLCLKCIAARAVKSNKIPYHGHIPVMLEQFVQIH